MKTYTVTVQLRTGEQITRKWTSAEDAADAIFLTITSLKDADKERIVKVDVQEVSQ